MHDPAPRDARPCPPWTDGPKPRTRSWPPGERPRLQVHLAGAWRWATVRQRQDWPDGQVAYQLDVPLPDPEVGYDTQRIGTYWFDPDTMRLPGRPARPPATGWRLLHTPGTRTAILHRDDCPTPGGGVLSRMEAELALTEDSIHMCPTCRPERDLN